jgi:hypothetical protein
MRLKRLRGVILEYLHEPHRKRVAKIIHRLTKQKMRNLDSIKKT